MTLHRENEGPSVATMGPKGQVKVARDVCVSWDDDEGMKHSHILTNVCCMCDSPFNIFSITEFGKDVSSNNH